MTRARCVVCAADDAPLWTVDSEHRCLHHVPAHERTEAWWCLAFVRVVLAYEATTATDPKENR